jgi:hypothetical protein
MEKLTPLPISREMWNLIDEEWNWAVLDSNGYVLFFNEEPFIYKPECRWLSRDYGEDYGDGCDSVLKINTNGINWEQSLTKRPEDV